MHPAGDLVEGGAVGRPVEHADERVGSFRHVPLELVEIRRQRLAPLAPAKRVGAEPAVRLAPEPLHLGGRGEAFLPAIPVLHRERRDRRPDASPAVQPW
jgi:hypothetical protein